MIFFLLKALITIFLLILPISIPMASLSNKPIEIVPGDFVIIIMVFRLFFLSRVNICAISSIKIPLFLVCYWILLSTIGAFWSSELSPILSACKLSKPFVLYMLILIIMWDTKFNDLRLLYSIIYISVTLWIIYLFCSAIASSATRKGSEIFGTEVYGFPNSYGNYLV